MLITNLRPFPTPGTPDVESKDVEAPLKGKIKELEKRIEELESPQ